MKALLLVLMFLGQILTGPYRKAGSLFIPPAYVQGSDVDVGGGPFFGCAIALPSVQHGDVLIIFGSSSHDGVTPATATDTAGDTFTEAAFNGSSGGLTVLVAPNVAGGNTTVDVDGLAEVNKCVLVEYSGVALTSPVDQATISAGTANPYPATPITTTHARDLIITAPNGDAYPTSFPSGYTLNFSDPASGMGLYTGTGYWVVSAKVVASTGTYNATWTYTSDMDVNVALLALKSKT